jgi:hypothetical protein
MYDFIGPACFGQGRRRAARHFSQLPYPSFGVDPWVTDCITPLANSPSRPMQSDNLCIAWSLPGNRRARRGFLAHSAVISGGPFILFPSGLFFFSVALQLLGQFRLVVLT